MKIYSMTATFGKLAHSTLTLRPGLNVIHAPNEWGKSTWCAFLSAMLYGIDTRERTTAAALAVKEHYAPWSGAPMAGRMDLCWNGRDITIERKSKGRVPFGDFKAYETESGLAVPELTADNCGKLLLGVEKSVFTRTGFIRLADMPVTQDEALRRRLNDLVTTGDESGQSDALAQKLRDLKNKVRSNRSNGLLPQALTEKQTLEAKLSRYDDLRAQQTHLRARQAEVSDFAEKLHNHKKHLAWAAAADYAQKARDAKAKLAAADLQVTQLQAACAQLPTEEALQAQSQAARHLNAQKDALQLELAMLPAAPAAPQTPGKLSAISPDQARQDAQAYAALTAQTGSGKGLWIAAGVCMAAFLVGIVLLICKLVIPAVVLMALGVAGCLIAGILSIAKSGARKQRAAQAQAIADRYAPLPPDRWVAAAQEHAAAQDAYTESLTAQQAARNDLQTRLQQLLQQLAALPGTEEDRASALALRRQLADALREQQHLKSLVQTLQTTGQAPEQPQTPDSLTYSAPDTARLLSDAELETRQLHTRLGQLEGQMQTLGSREALQTQLDGVNARLAKLEQTYAALELAQSTLTQAATALQRRFAPEITRQAQQNFARITAGRYDRLALTDDLTLHAAATDEDTLTSSLWRSDGTADQLYLSLRLAVAQALTPEAPLVLDDALARFDDTRLANTMALLQDTAAQKQVILFTCHTREQQAIEN